MAKAEPNFPIARAVVVPTTAGIVATIPTTVDRILVTASIVINYGFESSTFNIWLLPATGGTTANEEASLLFKRVGAFETLELDEIIGQHIEGGGTIRAESSVVNALSFTANGTTFPLGYD